MASHLVTARIWVSAPDWREAEEYVRAIPAMLGPSSECHIEAVHWEESCEEDEEDEE